MTLERARDMEILAIRLRMQKAIDRDLAQTAFFNNFKLNFKNPGGLSNYRNIIEKRKKMDVPNGEIYGSSIPDCSELWLKQTPREFFSQVDAVVEECGLSVEGVGILVSTIEKKESQTRFYGEVAPEVFMKLIEMGYNVAELTF